MSTKPIALFWLPERFHLWALDNSPASRRQAFWGSVYRLSLHFFTNKMAMAGLSILVFFSLMSIFVPFTVDPSLQDLDNRLSPPAFFEWFGASETVQSTATGASSTKHWFGTDELGRDIYSRIWYGGRVTLGMVVAVVSLVAPLGLLVGCFAGYHGGLVDKILMRVTDVFLAFPSLILALALVAALKPGVESVVLAIALTAWPPYARLARAETLTILKTDYIAACKLTGASSTRIILRHITPLCLPTLIVRTTLGMGAIIITAASLGFLGMGVQPPSPEWGAMIANAQRFILKEWWVPVVPGMVILLTSVAFNFLGDGLRDILDPKNSR